MWATEYSYPTCRSSATSAGLIIRRIPKSSSETVRAPWLTFQLGISLAVLHPCVLPAATCRALSLHRFPETPLPGENS